MSRLIIKRLVSKYFPRHKNVRLFSSTTTSGLNSDGDEIICVTTKLRTPINCSFSSTPTNPLSYVLNTPDSLDGRVIRIYESNDATGILIRDKKLMEEVRHAMTIGFSRHNGIELKLSEMNSQEIVIDYNLINTKSSTPARRVRLPPLPNGFRIQSLAMGSELNSEEDWVVGVKSCGSSQLCFFKSGHGKWIKIETSPEFMHPFSSITYSKIYKRFYIPTPGGYCLYSLCLDFKEGDHPDFIDLLVDELPESVMLELNELSSGSMTDHLVESPSGELYLIKWYGHDTMYNDNNVETLMHVTSKFMVFRAEEGDDEMVYTEDIGDLCIFLGHSQAFCIPASSCPGLKPNCIYFVGYNFGVYDLTTKICTRFYIEDDVPLRNLEFPYWPPPVSHDF